MDMWEYKVLDLESVIDGVPIEDQLNIYGCKGWELVS